MLTQERVIELLNYDAETGIFTRKITTSSRAQVGAIAGSVKKFKTTTYNTIRVGGAYYKAHRLAWLYVYGHFPKADIDHIDGDGSNNAISNLRLARGFQNKANSRLRSNNSSGFKGVSFSKRARKWMAQIQYEGNNIYLGLHATPEDAHRAYWAKAKELFGEFARAA